MYTHAHSGRKSHWHGDKWKNKFFLNQFKRLQTNRGEKKCRLGKASGIWDKLNIQASDCSYLRSEEHTVVDWDMTW